MEIPHGFGDGVGTDWGVGEIGLLVSTLYTVRIVRFRDLPLEYRAIEIVYEGKS